MKNFVTGTVAVEPPPPVMNDPRLFAPTRVRVLKSFYLDGKPAPAGAEVNVPYHVARDMVALGKAKILSTAGIARR